MSASGKIPAVHVLRGILRRLKVNKSELAASHRQRSWKSAPGSYVLGRYSSSNNSNIDPQQNRGAVTKEDLHKLAYEYLILRQDIDERLRLQRLDTGAENQLSPKEMSRRAAARAGLELPKLNPNLPD
mmetsp:Transcript_30461/g.65367  ORF Transcript_30461/g.65367 Transcript_30461/m.65367 type:complete len:128 (+) Transcript_30461:262-645(+)